MAAPSGKGPARARASLALVGVAAVAGCVHAAWSLYWALGGQELLPTVGRWAVELSSRSPLLAGLGLGFVAVVKLLAALVPVGVAVGRVGRRRLWRAVSWAGGALLVVYGGLNVVVGAAVLSGTVHPAGGYDVAAMEGHAWLWDPLFLLWGLALVASLALSRSRAVPPRDRTPAPARP